VLPQQCTPTSAPSRCSATTSSRSSCMASRCLGLARSKAYRPGSSRKKRGVVPARRSAFTIASVRASTSRKMDSSSPGTSSVARPSVVRATERTVKGPASCALAKASFRFSTSQRNGRQARQPSSEGSKASSAPEDSAVSSRAWKSARPASHSARSTVHMPSSSNRRPGNPSSACGIMNSEGRPTGSCGRKGMSSASAAWRPISSWVCGRLPMPVVAQVGRSWMARAAG
jgi:hypothetical protein